MKSARQLDRDYIHYIPYRNFYQIVFIKNRIDIAMYLHQGIKSQ